MLYCLLIVAGQLSFQGEAASPFVAGFERFARHEAGEQLGGGRLMLGELNCTACHAGNDTWLRPKLGPRLDGAGDRLHADWIRRYLEAPNAVKPGTTMPNVLGNLSPDERASAARALAAFLSGQHLPYPEVKGSGAIPVPHEFWNKGDSARGGELYHRVGCVACHEPDAEYAARVQTPSMLDKLLEQLSPAEIEELGLAAATRPVRSVPHGDLPRKYNVRSLTLFLLDPESVRPGGRMPSLKLTPVEAADIAAFLLPGQAADHEANASAADNHLAERGRWLFQEMNCSACHAVKTMPASPMATPLAELKPDAASSCIAAARRGLPHYALDDLQAKSLRHALADLRSAKTADASPPDALHFQMAQLNCYACHERNRRGGVGNNRQQFFDTLRHMDLGDEGRLPPPLTGVGGKLQPAWLTKVLDGAGDVRPHVLARMPRFAKSSTASLPALFAAADGAERQTEQQVFGDRERPAGRDNLAEAGRRLLDTGCVQCHAVRGETLPGVAGIDMLGVADRLQPQWFRAFLLNPAELKPGTRMPAFFLNGKSANPDILGGDVERQVAAMWTYIKDLNRNPLPDKIVRARLQDFELVPKERPIVLRTFMQAAGTHAIAVGFPQHTHFAFDAEGVRLAEAWRGRFLDAHGNWIDRFAPLAAPLGQEIVAFPPGGPLAVLADSEQPWPAEVGPDAGYRFLGYRLDRGGVPTLLYRYQQWNVEDRLEPSGQRGLKRKLTIHAASAADQEREPLWFRALTGGDLQLQQTGSYKSDAGLLVTVKAEHPERGALRKLDKNAEWIIPISVVGTAKVEVEYQW